MGCARPAAKDYRDVESRQSQVPEFARSGLPDLRWSPATTTRPSGYFFVHRVSVTMRDWASPRTPTTVRPGVKTESRDASRGSRRAENRVDKPDLPPSPTRSEEGDRITLVNVGFDRQ
jgi:hypothetical protein